MQHSGIPLVGLHQQVAVALQVGGQPRDGLLQPQLLGKVITDGGETRPHPHAVGVAARLLRGGFDGFDAALQRFRGEIGMQDDVVESTAAEFQGVGAKCHQRQSDVFVEVRVEKQNRVLAHRAVVVEDQLAVEQPPHDLSPVFHLRGRDRRYAECGVDGRDAPADAQREPTAGEPVHGGRPRSGDQGVAGVVIGCGGGDLHAVGHRARGPDQG